MPVKRYNGSSWDVVAGAGVTGAPGSNGTNGTNGLDASPYVAGKNFVINGGFDIWQRGTSSTSSGVYLADRWIHGRAGGASGGTYTRQTATDSSTLPFLQYSFRLQRDSGNTSTAQLNLNQVIETANSLPLAGRTVTLSFYARVGANFSATSGTVAAYLFTGTGTDQNGVLGAWTGSANPLSTSFTGATTSWQRFQATATLSSTTNEIYFGVGFTPTGTAGAADWLEIAGVQLEVGSTATSFSRAGGTIAGELAVCQRYFQSYNNSGSTYVLPMLFSYADGSYFGTTVAEGPMILPVQMRTAPTLTTIGTFAAYAFANHGAAGTLSLENANARNVGFRFDKSSGSWTSSVGYANTSNGYINLSAEL
jgi:hypothetical protein